MARCGPIFLASEPSPPDWSRRSLFSQRRRRPAERRRAPPPPALKAVAGGDLSARLEQPYSRDYEALRHCFNESIDRLNATFGATAHGVRGLRGGIDEISGAMNDLSDRTGRQAASVEEASAT